MSRLKQFSGANKLKKAALTSLVKMLHIKDTENLTHQFEIIDGNNTGFIEIDELETAIKLANFDLNSEEIKNIVEELDLIGNHKINYSEFLAATVSVKEILTHDRLEILFKQFDIDNLNLITEQNIKQVFT